jgi:hypothetical protein
MADQNNLPSGVTSASSVESSLSSRSFAAGEQCPAGVGDQSDRLLADHRSGHSEFQIDRFILARGNWTAYGRYKQSLREIHKRRRALEDLESRRRCVEVDLDEAICECRSRWLGLLSLLRSSRRFERRRARLRIAEHRRALGRLTRDVEETRRELSHFERAAAQLAPLLGKLTDERRRYLDEHLWNVRVRTMAACDLMTRGQLSEGTLEILIAMPVSMRSAILQEVRATLFAQRQGLDGPLLHWLERDELPGAFPATATIGHHPGEEAECVAPPAPRSR